MILELNGRNLAFGMRWGAIADSNVKAEAQARARSAKSPLMWMSSELRLVGLLDGNDKSLKFKTPVYSGAIVLKHALRNYPTIFAAFGLEAGGFAVIGIEGGKPKQGFDCVKFSEDEVLSLKKEFAASYIDQQILYIGNTTLLGGINIELQTIADYVDKDCLLKKPDMAIPKSIKPIAIFGAVFIGAFFAWDQYKNYESREIHRKALEKQKAIQIKYETILMQRRKEVLMAKESLPGFLSFIKAWPTNIGGWWVDGFKCKTRLPVECEVSLSKSGYRLATFQTFYNEAGKRFSAVSLNPRGDKILGIVKLDTLKGYELGAALDASKSSDEAINELGSMLQIFNAGKMPFASDNGVGQLEFSAFALPPGVAKTKLTKPPYRFNTWNVSIPARELELFMTLPRYALIESIEIKIARKNTYAVQDSFVMATVKGIAFAKPL